MPLRLLKIYGLAAAKLAPFLVVVTISRCPLCLRYRLHLRKLCPTRSLPSLASPLSGCTARFVRFLSPSREGFWFMDKIAIRTLRVSRMPLSFVKSIARWKSWGIITPTTLPYSSATSPPLFRCGFVLCVSLHSTSPVTTIDTSKYPTVLALEVLVARCSVTLPSAVELDPNPAT